MVDDLQNRYIKLKELEKTARADKIRAEEKLKSCEKLKKDLEDQMSKAGTSPETISAKIKSMEIDLAEKISVAEAEMTAAYENLKILSNL